jgi:Site-specific recombinase XerD
MSKSPRKRVAPSLYKSESSGVYFAHVRSGSKLYRESLETDDRSLANRRLREFRRKISRIDPGLSKTTLAAMCDLYLETIEHHSKSTKKGRRGIIKRLKDTFYGADCVPLGDIKSSQLESWLSKQAARLSASHYNTFLTTLRDIFALAVRDRYIADDPTAAFKYRKREQPIRLTPSFEDFQAIVTDIRNERFNADSKDSANFVEFIGLAGVGQAEAAGLRRKHVHLDFGQIQLFRHKTRQAFTIPIYPQVRPLLERLCKGLKPDDRVFPISSARKALAGACARLGLPHYTHRSFRRMFITRAIELGVDIKTIADWQGHRDGGKLILSTYSHVRPEHSQRMSQLMTTEQPSNVVALSTEEAAS